MCLIFEVYKRHSKLTLLTPLKKLIYRECVSDHEFHAHVVNNVGENFKTLFYGFKMSTSNLFAVTN